jgi:hypothetical protein
VKHWFFLGVLPLFACSSPTTPTPIDDAADVLVQDDAVDVPGDVPVAYPQLQPTLCLPTAPVDLLGYDRAYPILHTQPESTYAWVQDKDWYLLTVLQQVPEAKAALLADPTLLAMAQTREAKLRNAAGKCDADTGCLAAQVAWTPDEITQTAAQVGKILAQTSVAKKHLRPSGRYALYVKQTDEALIAAATTDALNTLQSVFNGYEKGRAEINSSLALVASAHPQPMQFFEPLLWTTLDGMKASNHDQAGRDEPLADGQNKAALERMKTIDWTKWRFSVVLGLGWGPDDASPLSILGQQHADIVADRFLAGLAPFILLTGGHVHPADTTPYSEALEMKKYLMTAYSIPEDAILVDPHARHTTTNFRNIARQFMMYGMPMDKPGLLSSDVAQTFYTLHIDVRCMQDLGYLPYRSVQSLDEQDNCFLPAAESMFYDARDERDP